MINLDTNETLRLFWGIPISQEIADNLNNKLIKKFPLVTKHIRFTKPENLHITVRFLGNVDANSIPIIIYDVNEVMHDFSSFIVKIDKVGPFPSIRSRLIAAYVEMNAQLKLLYERITKISLTKSIGQREERSFKPHITLARANRGHSLAVSYFSIEQCECFAKELVLYQSKPTNKGSLYLPVHRFNLKN